MSQPLEELANAFGVITSYHDIDGIPRRAGQDALVSVLRALGAPLHGPADALGAMKLVAASRATLRMEPVHVVREGTSPAILLRGESRARAEIRLYREDGSSETWSAAGTPAHTESGPAQRFVIDRPLPCGLHVVVLESESELFRTTIVHAPRLAPQPQRPRSWGLFAPIHAFGDRISGGVPSYTDLTRVARWAGSIGAEWVSTLPLLASFLDEPFEPSPYVPVSRLFWNDLYIDAARAPGADYEMVLPPLVPDSGDYVDYRCIAQAHRSMLEAAARRFYEAGGDRDPAFRAWLDDHPRAAEYARFRSLGDRHRTRWQDWPSGTRDRGAHPEGERFHAWAAWVADSQIARLAAASNEGAAALYLDMPLGVHPSGFDTWHEPTLFAAGISVGAPPDPFFRDGQNWGFPPLDPAAIRRDGLLYLRDCIRHHLEHAGMLRLDHVMALERLFWIPDGMPATEGVYVRYPRDELIALLALEARRHGTVIVGEDLGTVTPEIRRALDDHSILRMYVAQFEFSPAPDPPIRPPARNVVAALNTHDLPTFAAFWAGLDIEDQFALGQLDGDAKQRAQEERRVLRARLREWAGADAVDDDDAARKVLHRLLEWLAESDAAIQIVTLEDLWLETRPQNVPGTTHERPNWKRRARHDFASLMTDPDVRATLLRVATRRRDPTDRHAS